MKHNWILIGLAAMAIMSACDVLDKNPDQRATIDTKQKVQLLLVNAYSHANINSICEVTSDNTIDNNAPTSTGQTYTLSAYNRSFHEIFAFQPVVSSTTQDSPYYIWQNEYKAIATANQALEAIAKIEAEGKEDVSAAKGEAYLCRAWAHFRLANVFCQAYGSDEWNEKQLGLIYMTKPETTVKPVYTRLNLKETYRMIQQDIEDGLVLVSDDYYTVPRYHFNTAAAHAFAARFYLYTRQWSLAEQEATKVLGTDPQSILSKLFDADYALNKTPSSDVEVYAYIDGTKPYNLLIQTTMSSQILMAQSAYGRYQVNGDAKTYSVSGEGPCWENTFPGIRKWTYSSEYGIFIAKIKYFFEYTNKVSGTGYRHTINRSFTTNETLLVRAEARVHQGNLTGALEDLQLWCKSYDVKETSPMTELTDAKIRDFYKVSKAARYSNKTFTPQLHNEDLDPSWSISSDKLPYIWCCLHFRRIETMHDGLRLFDLKRYGIEWTHTIGEEATVKHMVWDDDRRAIQLPEEVIVAGLEANPRENVAEKDYYVADGNETDPTDLELLAADGMVCYPVDE